MNPLAVPPVLCPACGAREFAGHELPLGYRLRRAVDQPMGVLMISHSTRSPEGITAPHFLYICSRCGFGEIHEHPIYLERTIA